MTLSRHNANSSRGDHSRPASAARSIIQKRDKPYRTEQGVFWNPKKKLNLQTASARPPVGYTYVAFGTPELADRCKELSRTQSIPVYIVNAKPNKTKYANDPEKVSNHVHRIGYHFNATLVAEACLQLGYTLHRGQFVKETELAEQNNRNRMAQIMANHGYVINDSHVEDRENADYLRAAMRELFPKMPALDMEQIIKHAWADGSLRVGTNAALTLPRRIQLATIARIRHTYTDYDALLRAFGDWAGARQQVEPHCLAKMREWRGENAQDDAEERELITREFIVIDDDDDDMGDLANRGHEADDEDSAAEQGYASETSIEVTHHQARDEDLGAESSNESTQRYIERLRPRQYDRTVARPRRPSPADSFDRFDNFSGRPRSSGAPSAYVHTRPQYSSRQPPPARVVTPPPFKRQKKSHIALGDHFDHPIVLSSPPQSARYEYLPAQPPPPAFQYSPTNSAQAPAYPEPIAPMEMIVDGKIFRKVPAEYDTGYQQVPYALPNASHQQPHIEPAYSPHNVVVPSIEGYGTQRQRPQIEENAPRKLSMIQSHPAPVSSWKTVDYVDLTGLGTERRLPAPSQPIHGAPAPVQQIPRSGYHAR